MSDEPQFQVVQQQLKELTRVVGRLDEAVRGNGREGLNERVSIIEEALKQLPQVVDAVDKLVVAMAELRRDNKWLDRAITVAVGIVASVATALLIGRLSP